MTTTEMADRIRGLTRIATLFSQEVARLQKAEPPLMEREQEIYLAGLQDSIGGLDAARGAMAETIKRLMGEATSAHFLSAHLEGREQSLKDTEDARDQTHEASDTPEHMVELNRAIKKAARMFKQWFEEIHGDDLRGKPPC